MAVPDFQTLMLPVLKACADGADKSHADLRTSVSADLRLSSEDIATPLPSGRQSRFANRMHWAVQYLKRAGLLESPKRSIHRITERGREVLQSSPPGIDIPFLEQYPEFVEFRTPTDLSAVQSMPPGMQHILTHGIPASMDGAELTPDEQVRSGAARLRENLAAELLERIKRAPSEFFEQLVVDLLVAMGYGGSHEDAARVVGRSGDGGIDGIIAQDRLGLESIYVQAKRWEASVGRPTVQQFVGALHTKHARKGVVMTTSSFTREAIECAAGLQTTVVLIDGLRLAQLMIEYGVGVATVEAIEIKRLDEDYFSDDADP